MKKNSFGFSLILPALFGCISLSSLDTVNAAGVAGEKDEACGQFIEQIMRNPYTAIQNPASAKDQAKLSSLTNGTLPDVPTEMERQRLAANGSKESKAPEASIEPSSWTSRIAGAFRRLFSVDRKTETIAPAIPVPTVQPNPQQVQAALAHAIYANSVLEKHVLPESAELKSPDFTIRLHTNHKDIGSEQEGTLQYLVINNSATGKTTRVLINGETLSSKELYAQSTSRDDGLFRKRLIGTLKQIRHGLLGKAFLKELGIPASNMSDAEIQAVSSNFTREQVRSALLRSGYRGPGTEFFSHEDASTIPNVPILRISRDQKRLTIAYKPYRTLVSQAAGRGSKSQSHRAAPFQIVVLDLESLMSSDAHILHHLADMPEAIPQIKSLLVNAEKSNSGKNPENILLVDRYLSKIVVGKADSDKKVFNHFDVLDIETGEFKAVLPPRPVPFSYYYLSETPITLSESGSNLAFVGGNRELVVFNIQGTPKIVRTATLPESKTPFALRIPTDDVPFEMRGWSGGDILRLAFVPGSDTNIALFETYEESISTRRNIEGRITNEDQFYSSLENFLNPPNSRNRGNGDFSVTFQTLRMAIYSTQTGELRLASNSRMGSEFTQGDYEREVRREIDRLYRQAYGLNVRESTSPWADAQLNNPVPMTTYNISAVQISDYSGGGDSSEGSRATTGPQIVVQNYYTEEKSSGGWVAAAVGFVAGALLL